MEESSFCEQKKQKNFSDFYVFWRGQNVELVMSKEALEFLDRRLSPHIAAVSAYVEPDRGRFDQLAESCKADAAKDGLQRGELDEAAGGDLAGFLYSAVLETYREEKARVREKD